ncbi:hypothetical protein E2C01_076386 [Portunus trituberculatus]|uniref:Uncharacterized protein n=1 Tax=Portunus trituberculatus TaxID=210409 RepID=A0A5B7IHJ1_PORTR|nr:hypothetical protein [Portunus trituberculatus]
MLVLTKSYAGNLMSLLAVRYVPQPFQTIQDVLDHPSVVMIWEKHSRSEQFLRDVESGMFKELAELEQKGRLEFHTQSQFLATLSTLVKIGRHILVIGDITISLRFWKGSRTIGKSDHSAALVSPKCFKTFQEGHS